MTAKPSITLMAAPVSRCAAAQEMAQALRVLQQIAARLDSGEGSILRGEGINLRGSQEKPAGEGNEGV